MDMSHTMIGDYMAHGFCFAWEKKLVALHVVSDIVTGIAYYSIPIAMFYVAYRRRDLPFYRLFLLFALFILACGTTHFFAAYTVFVPAYWAEGYVKAVTAAISALTAVLFIPRLPQALALPSIAATIDEVKHLNRELEEKNRELQLANFSLERVMDPIFWVSREGRIWKVNEAACAALEYTREELLRLAVSDIDPHFPAERWPGHWQETQEKGALRFETQHRTKSGRLFDVEVVVNHIVFEGEEFNCAIVRETTDRKKAEAERLRLEQQILHAQKLEGLGVLAGGIAHDFNNILTAVIGNADLALRKIGPESPVIENLRRIEQAAVNAADLAKQMLAYSGKGKFVVEAIDMNRLLEGMLHLLEVSISKKAVLRLNLSQPLYSIDADATQVRQVVMNLVINASEAIGDKSGFIAVTTGCVECDRNYLRGVWLDEQIPEGLYVFLEVADTGCGMDRETLAKIFDPFFTTKFTGRGLGMAAVLGIVRGHRGAIKVYSEPGKGTTFKVLFPATGRPSELFNGNETEEGWRGQGTVLVADDEETVRGIASEMLRELGFEVVTACNGREAVDQYRNRGRFDLVLLDLTMPNLDGEQTFRELRLIDPRVRVIMTSGYNEQEVTQRFVGKGLAGFIQKPFKLSTLREAIQKVEEG